MKVYVLVSILLFFVNAIWRALEATHTKPTPRWWHAIESFVWVGMAIWGLVELIQ